MKKFVSLLFISLTFYIGNSQTITGSTSYCQGGSTTLTVTGAPGGSTFQWTLNTANITNATNISLLVTTSGTYNVIVTTAGNPTLLTDVIVTENPRPNPDFTFTNNTCSGISVPFVSSISSGTGPFNYLWDFGDATTSTAQNPTHTYTSLGCGNATFQVRLTVTDANGCSNNITKPVSIKQAPDVQVKDQSHPFSEFNNCGTSPSTSNPNFTVIIANISPNAGCITLYTVDWGDGLIQNLPPLNFPLSHTYAQLGTFNLTVTATGSNGCTNSKTYTVVNQANPAVGISGPGGTSGCGPVGFWFKLTQYQLNSPGTTYIWNFGDGTSTITWTTPITIDSIFHIFTSSSCGQPGNQYTVKVTAKNGCDSTAATVNNIKIFKKPVANFSSPASACTSVPVLFTNTTIESYNQPNCNRATIYEWNFGDGTPNSTNQNPSHTYIATGNYTVQLIATGQCGNDTISRVICIVNTPISAFTINPIAGCTPLNVTATNNSNTLTNCIAATYLWTVTYSSSNCGTASLWNFTNNTNSSSVNPSFTFTNPGTYTITLRVTNACGTTTSSNTVTVKKPPTVSLNAISNQCTPATINPVANATNCGSTPLTYSWSFPGGNPSSSNIANPGSVLYNTAGTYTITLNTSNECGITTTTQQFTVRDQPATPTAGSNSPLCTGATLILTSTAGPAGATYSWTGPGGYNSTLQNPIRPTSTIAMSGNYSVIVTLNGCSSLPATVPVIINQSPTIPTVTTPVNYCLGATAIPLIATGAAGNTFLWYTTATGGTGTATAPTPSTAIAGTTTYYVSQVNTSGTCESSRVPIIVNVSAIAVINGNSTNPTTCTSTNGTIIISGLPPNTTYSVQYIKNGGSPININLTTNSSGIITISNLSAGTYSGITVTLNSCVSNLIGPFILVDPSPPASPTIGSNSPLCSGNTLNLTSSAAPAGATYSWTGPIGFTSTLQNPPRNNVTTVMSGTYSLTITLSGCSSVPASLSVTINPTPVLPVVTTPLNYCQGDVSVPLTATALSGNTLLWYTVATGGTGNTIAPTPLSTSVGSTTYYVSQVSSTGSCESARAPIIVNVNPIPVINGSSSNPTTCSSTNGTITISGLASLITYYVQYARNGGTPVIVNLTSNNSGIITITGLSAGSYTNITVRLNGCTSNLIGPFTLVDPSPPASPTVGSNSPICSGNTINLSSTPAPAGAIYSWTGPLGFTSTLQNPIRTNVTTAMSGIYSVIVTLNGCSSMPATVNVVINQTPAFPTILTPVNYCQGAIAIPLTANAAPGNTLLWYTTATGGIGSTFAPTPSTTTMGSSTYYVSQVTPTGPCESSRAPITVIVNPIPVINGSSSNPTTCTSTNGTITVSGLTPNTTFTVQYIRNGGTPVTITLIANNNGVIIIPNLPAGTYTNINVTLNGCTSNDTGPFTLLNPAGPVNPTAASNSPLCTGGTLNLTSSSAPAGTTYTWSGPANFNSTLQNPVITNVTSAMNGVYSLTVTLNGCTTTPVTIPVVINQTPALPIVTTPVNYCQGMSSTPLTAINSPGFNLLWYSVPTGGTGSSSAPIPTTNTVGITMFYVSQVNPTGNCESGRTPIVVNVNPIANITGSSTNPTTCTASDGAIRLTGLLPNTFYSVPYTLNGGIPTTFNFISNSSGTILISNLSAGTYTNITVSSNGCQSNIVGPFILADPSAPATPVLITNSPLCSGSILNLTASNVPAGAIYSWTGPAGFASSLPNPIRTNVTPAMSGVYSLIVTLNNCSSIAGVSNVIIGDYPIVTLGPDLTIPYGTQFTINSTIQNGPITTYLWTPSSNLNCTNCPVPVADIKASISYILKVTNIYGCSAADTINLKVICDNSNVFIPNAFSPDGDGINDVLMVRAAAPIVIKYFRIFNKWGELVFEKNNFPPNITSYGWDGKVKGKTGPPDVYVFTAEVICDNGSSYIYKGNVTLIK